MIRTNSVIVIGDRKVGKTNTILTLEKPGTCNVQILNDLSPYRDPKTKKPAGTAFRIEETLEMEVKLPAGKKKLFIKWIDTPGERWEDLKKWQEDHPGDWEATQNVIKESAAIFLIVPPHSGLILHKLFTLHSEGEMRQDDYPNLDQWKNNLDHWFKFFREYAPQTRHLLIAIHKADFFYDPNADSQRWCACNRRPIFYDYQEQIRRRYFAPIDNLIRDYNSEQRYGQQVQFFITSKNNKCLLEIPWLYLASHFQ
jgi:hypothetical protein